MHFFIYLLSLLLVALSTDGLGLPPGWWCGTKPCDARMKEVEDSRINDRAVRNTTATDTALNNTAVTGRPITDSENPGIVSCGWWCRAKKTSDQQDKYQQESEHEAPDRLSSIRSLRVVLEDPLSRLDLYQ